MEGKQTNGQIVMMKVADVVPYEKNPRKNDNAVEKVANSIREFGFRSPIVLDKNNVIISGHTRLRAAIKLSMDAVPCIVAADLSDERVRALRLADNKTAEFAIWDEDMLKDELDALAQMLDINMEMFGFDLGLDDLEDDLYTTKADVPQYEIKGEKPDVGHLTDTSVRDGLLSSIEAATDITDGEREFLRAGACRHIVFDYAKIAEYYANATPTMQRLMEASSLVIIDYDNAMRDGYLELDGAMSDMLKGDDDDA